MRRKITKKKQNSNFQESGHSCPFLRRAGKKTRAPFYHNPVGIQQNWHQWSELKYLSSCIKKTKGHLIPETPFCYLNSQQK